MERSQPIRLPPDDGRIIVRARKRRSDDYSMQEKAAIARLVVTPNARIECPRCEDHLELKASRLRAVEQSKSFGTFSARDATGAFF